MGDAFGVNDTVESICDDLADEHAALEAVVSGLDERAWDLVTPAAPWRVRDQIGHLTFYDRTAALAARTPDEFVRWMNEAMTDMDAYNETADAVGRELTGEPLMTAWRDGRRELLEALRAVPPDTRIPWYGPDMSPKSFTTARLMETWAHGQDVVDTLGATRPATDRLRHIAFIGWSTRGWSYAVRGLEPRDVPMRVELKLPSGEAWAQGDPDAGDRVSGEALDFCLVVTQRRNVADTGLVVEGDNARSWMEVAQAFAGPPTEARPPA
jgi:uncharacterized protein (TIGR03084 family)